MAQIAIVPETPAGQTTGVGSVGGEKSRTADRAGIGLRVDESVAGDYEDEVETDPGLPSRTDVEGLAVNFMQVLAETGLTDNPRFPGITMTPLAIYRDVVASRAHA